MHHTPVTCQGHNPRRPRLLSVFWCVEVCQKVTVPSEERETPSLPADAAWVNEDLVESRVKTGCVLLFLALFLQVTHRTGDKGGGGSALGGQQLSKQERRSDKRVEHLSKKHLKCRIVHGCGTEGSGGGWGGGWGLPPSPEADAL